MYDAEEGGESRLVFEIRTIYACTNTHPALPLFTVGSWPDVVPLPFKSHTQQLSETKLRKWELLSRKTIESFWSPTFKKEFSHREE